MDPSLDPEDVAFAGVVGQRALLREGRLTAVELLDLQLARTARLQPRLNAFRTVFHEQARAEAQAADAALAAGDDRPLLGVPVAVKDNVDVAGHDPGRGTGSVQPPAVEDALQVRRLRAAGAVVVGTTHLPELALWPFTESATHGVTRNPWDPSRTSGGSSGGSGTAVAAGLVAAATASDGGGSIRVPAACCGLVGLKPQRGRVPLAPAEEHWLGLSVAGCLTRTVADHALVLDVLSDGGIGPLPDVGRLRIAWSTKAPVPTRLHPAVRGALEGTLAVLRDLGHATVQADPSYGPALPSFLVRYGRGVADDLAELADPSRTEPRTRAVAALGRRFPASTVARARAWGDRAAAGLAQLPGGADVLLLPLLTEPPQRVGAQTGLRTLATAGRVVAFTTPWNVTGQPALSLPAGHTADGVPLAVQLVGRPDDEALLLALAAQLEAATGYPARRPLLDRAGDLA